MIANQRTEAYGKYHPRDQQAGPGVPPNILLVVITMEVTGLGLIVVRMFVRFGIR
jgi:hypothetical protein